MSKRISIRFFSSLRQYGQGEKEICLPWYDGMKVGDALGAFDIPDGVERVILVNSRHSKAETKLFAGDTIIVFPPVAGG